MASNNLVPEKRINKHGVPVTKHVKSASTPESRSLIPAPVNPELDGLVTAIIDDLPSWGMGKHDMEQAFKTLKYESPKLAMDIARAYLAGNKEYRAVWRNLLSRSTKFMAASEADMRLAIEAFSLSVELQPDAPSGFRFSVAMQHLEVTRERRESGDYSETKSEMMLAAINSQSENAPDRRERTEFITEHYDALLPLLPHLQKRGDSSIEFMQLMLENKSPSLSDGVL